MLGSRGVVDLKRIKLALFLLAHVTPGPQYERKEMTADKLCQALQAFSSIVPRILPRSLSYKEPQTP